MIYVEMRSLSIDKDSSPLAITMGDPSGINSEILLKTYLKIKEVIYLFSLRNKRFSKRQNLGQGFLEAGEVWGERRSNLFQ